MNYATLSKEDMYDLLRAYDIYIYKACESGLFDTGWKPCGVEEFFESEYQTVWKSRIIDYGDYSCWDYMYRLVNE